MFYFVQQTIPNTKIQFTETFDEETLEKLKKRLK